MKVATRLRNQKISPATQSTRAESQRYLLVHHTRPPSICSSRWYLAGLVTSERTNLRSPSQTLSSPPLNLTLDTSPARFIEDRGVNQVMLYPIYSYPSHSTRLIIPFFVVSGNKQPTNSATSFSSLFSSLQTLEYLTFEWIEYDSHN